MGGGGDGIAQSVQRLATGWAVRGLNPGGGGGRDFPDSSALALGVLPASYTMGIGSLSRGLSGRGVAFTTHPI